SGSSEGGLTPPARRGPWASARVGAAAAGAPELVRVEVVVVQRHRVLVAVVAVVLDLLAALVVRDDEHGQVALRVDEAPARAAARRRRVAARRQPPLDALDGGAELGPLLRAQVGQRPVAGVAVLQGVDHRAEVPDEGADARLGDRVAAGALDEDGV